MDIIRSSILGIIQGLTEFLPVSSSGHLAIAAKLLGIKPDVAFDVMLHIATLLAVCAFFYRDILDILYAFFIKRDVRDPDFRLGLLIIIASIPTAIIGFTLKDIFEEMFSSLLYVGLFLVLTGILISLAESFGKARKSVTGISWLDSLIIGLAQGCAIAPGLSRSGTTISTSLLLGLERPLAARFSFLLSIPAILGASALKIKAISHEVTIAHISGFILAVISGYFAIWAFMRLIQRASIRPFAYYCFAAGALTVLLSFLF